MTIITFIIVLLVLILVHEFGHFITAKRSGARVDEFGIGFPPKVVGIRRGETLYSLNLIPFGGFVRIFGEDPTQVADDDPDRHRAISNLPKKKQALILVAGVAMNVLLAWVLYIAVLAIGVPAVLEPENQAYVHNEALTVGYVVPDSPAEQVGIEAQDIISSIETETASLYTPDGEGVSAFIQAHADEELRIVLMRDGEEKTVTVRAESWLIEGEETPAIGISMALVGTLRYPIHRAVIEGTKETFSTLYRVAVGIGGFIYDALRFQADLSSVAGPVGIVSLVGVAASSGFTSLLLFTALISLHLAVINVIPFPALDGGRLLFLGIESVKGSKIKPAIAQWANLIGFALLILLMVAVTYNDILRLIV
ncbi:hypothetical protein COU17_02210 [Candidatus Kaiserbacteria bacterium CG10_big_fil_rev_8_21_14_0_10_49_17]|uniref:Zinc metalloprotease n=1 Tax=Candidatus Kaiserbacteria bacterium CG10_big_fil_rev_8_21_14_0_10_49_17 TaxID=1974609 RepID=A0A2M6WE50_9BACT|nr:MAG: hypothetical protein COU17_02210 [Candidatus Kaiserbacteria bacterium CG10_big_fil_rev_8_21_14_0_10_49_17]